MAVVDVGGGNGVCYCRWLHFFRRRQWRPLTTAMARVDKGKGGLGRGDEGVPAV